MAEALSWQSRPLEQMYPVVFFDALRVKIRTDGLVLNKADLLAPAEREKLRKAVVRRLRWKGPTPPRQKGR